MQINAAGQLELELKAPWPDGTTHRVMSPLPFMQRLAALVPRPRLHLIRYHGVLAPNARWRSQVVPQGARPVDEVDDSGSPAGSEGLCEGQARAVQAQAGHIGWARLLRRVFDIDMQHCPNGGAGQLRIIAAIVERVAIEKILSNSGSRYCTAETETCPDPVADRRGRIMISTSWFKAVRNSSRRSTEN